ncbi:MAG TPA: VWA domain-containing protein, partial [Polyangiaceae bacterium]|nr:VWA domain-containing protein [Polyangiaceae bacterium]
EEREMTMMLAIDVSRSERFGTKRSSKARLAAEVAAVCAFSAIRNNDRVGLILGSDHVEKLVPPQKGQKHVMRVVREIMSANPEASATDLSVLLETLSKVARRRSIAFLISDFLASGYERALSLAAARHDLIPILLADPRDDELPNVGLAAFEDLETGEEMLIDTSSAAVRDHYKKEMLAWREQQLKLFKKFGLDHCIVRTDRPYIDPLRELFARRARRAHR